VSQEAGFVHDAWSGDATPLDINDDGWLDLYVLNMQGNDECYENVQGRFQRRSQKFFPESVWGGMGVKSFDYNNDGLLDLLVTNMHADMWELEKNVNGPREKQKLAPGVIPESYLQSRKPGTNILGTRCSKAAAAANSRTCPARSTRRITGPGDPAPAT
jgi:hypothetical protein